MTTLKPCPFCGKDEANFTTDKWGYYYVECEYCGAQTNPYDDKEFVIEEWQTRPIEDDLRNRIAELGSELGRKSVELGELVGENILWKVINDKLKSSRENLERENDRLQEKVSDLLKRIAELEAEHRWIPVSERMPDDWESVLTIDISKSTQDVVTAFYNPEMSLWSTHFSYDLWVTHWMRLPEPPIVYGKECEE